MQNSFAICVLLSSLAFGGLRAQTGTCELRGDVQEMTGAPFGEQLSVELGDLRGGRPFDQNRLNYDNTFVFRNVPCGEYLLRVLDGSSRVLRQEYVTLHPNTFPISIRLNRPKRERPADGPVSVARLQAPIPKKAFHAFLSAQKHTHAQQYAKAATDLEKAIKLYPNYTEARTNLGVQYIRLGQPRKALVELQSAIEIGPPTAMQYGNLGFAFWALERYAEAESAARRAVSLDGSYSQAHYLLGVVLSRDSNRSAEAARHLQLITQEFPSARLNLAQVYARQGQSDAALKELREYQPKAPPNTRGLVETWIAQLQAGRPK